MENVSGFDEHPLWGAPTFSDKKSVYADGAVLMILRIIETPSFNWKNRTYVSTLKKGK